MGRLAWVALAMAAMASPALAQEPADGVRLSWARGAEGDGCIDGEALAAEVRRRLGRDPFTGEVRQTIEGTVGREDGRWVARLYDRDASGAEVGRRELTSESESCRALDAAVALAIALVIDPEAALRAPDEPPPEPAVEEPEPEPEPEASPARELAAPSEPPPPPPEPPDGRVVVGAHVAADMVPGAAVGLSIAADARVIGPLRARLGMLYFPETGTGGERATFAFGLTAATLDACVVLFEIDPVSTLACAGLAAGALHAVVLAPIPTRPGDYAWGGARASAEVSLSIGDRVFLALAVTGTVPFVRWAFRVEGRESPEFQQPEVVPSGSLSAGVRFW